MGSEVILIVEDNDVLRMGLQALLQSEGYDVQTAVHGVEALTIMRKQSPDLILSDIAMPEMDGHEFFDVVRQNDEWVAIPFIFLTARKERDDQLEGIRRGVEDYLIKPITRNQLVTTVRSRLARSRDLYQVQLSQAYQDSMIMLANAIEHRSPNTYGHVGRVRDHALAIAQQLGWSNGNQSNIEYGSILHDIGKIHIPHTLLDKPGPLNEREWALMKQHPILGVDLIKNIPFLAQAVPVIRHHHERWDGKGYPDGLAGDEIPLTARIVAVADALDAMTSYDNRPYRTALQADDAYEEILRCSGTQFDPTVVKAFQRAWTSIRKLLS